MLIYFHKVRCINKVLPPCSERLSIAISRKRPGEYLFLRPESCSMTKIGLRTVSLRLCEQKIHPAFVLLPL